MAARGVDNRAVEHQDVRAGAREDPDRAAAALTALAASARKATGATARADEARVIRTGTAAATAATAARGAIGTRQRGEEQRDAIERVGAAEAGRALVT